PDGSGNSSDLSAPPDMATSPLAGGYLALVDVQRQGARALLPVISFPPPGATHDYAATAPYFCYADHFDRAAGDLPPADLDDGVVTLSGYTGGPLAATGAQAPAQIQCEQSGGAYVCGYGTLGGVDPFGQPFVAGAVPITPGQAIEF